MRFTAIVQPLTRACHNRLVVALLAAAAAAPGGAAPAQAQFLFGGWRNRPPMQQTYLSPREIAAIIEDYGYRPLGRPRLTGELYVAEGRDARGYRTRFVVDAMYGNVVSRAVLATPLDRRLDLEALRPPAALPETRQASRSTEPTPYAPRMVPGQRPAESGRPRTKQRQPATAARPAVPELKPAAPNLVPPNPSPPNVETPNLGAPFAEPEKPAETAIPRATAARPGEPDLKPLAPNPPQLPFEPARPAGAAKPFGVEKPTPAGAEKPPVTAARPPAATEPLPLQPTTTPPSFEVTRPPPPTAIVPPAATRKPPGISPAAGSPSVRSPAVQAGPAPGASTVPPALLDDIKPKALPEPPPMVPPVTLD